jgi:DNA polymerase III sliding clamp (beta) subunit (PCNA family)
MASIGTEDVIMKFNTMSSPMIVTAKTEQGIKPDGLRLILPVRVAG